MSLRALAKGSPLPPLKEGSLRLYSNRFCPFAQRAHLVLDHKNIPYETINVHLKEKPEWLFERNPKGLVPVLEHDGKVLYESLIICNYLDEIFPEYPLTPKDPYKKAQDALLIDYFSENLVSQFLKTLRSKGRDVEAKESFNKSLKRFEDELARRGTFFGGADIALIDFMLWPWFERLCLMQQSAASAPSETYLPRLYIWTKEMLNLPAVQASYLYPATHIQFIQAYNDDSPNYDIGLSS